VEMLCTHVWNGKIRHVETIPEWKEKEIKENTGKGEFNYDMLQELL
jgi:hypothetical protein